MLTNERSTSVRLVTNPEKIVIKETQRAFMYFCLYGLCIDAIIMNRVLPGAVANGYFEGWKEIQDRYVSSAEDYFAPVPILKVELFPTEIVGKKDLSELAEAIYGNRDPTQLFYRERPYKFAKRDGRAELKVKLPFTSKEDVELNKTYDELIIRVGSFKRHIPLPRGLGNVQPSGARIDGNTLTVFFGGKDAREKKSSQAAKEAGT